MNNHIKEYRKAYGWTQTDLGKRLGVTAANVSSWEVGRTEPTVAQSIRMSELFNCSVQELFGMDNDSTKVEKRIMVYAAKLNKLSNEQRDAVEQLIDNLSNSQKRNTIPNGVFQASIKKTGSGYKVHQIITEDDIKAAEAEMRFYQHED